MAARVEADILIPGSGDPISNGCVVFDGRRISYAGPIEGAPAPRSGKLRAGYVADILVVRENPLKRIAALADPENIVRVWKDGKLVVERPLAQ
jgi:hypothetical protein